MKNLDQKIEALYEQKRLKERIQLHLEGVKRRLGVRQKELSDIELKLDKSSQNMEELEQLSLWSLFLKALGNKKQQLERERQNYLMNYLNFKSCKERIEAKEYEIQVLQEKLATMKMVDGELDELLKHKKNHLKHRDKHIAKKIILIESNIRTYQYKQREIEEALASGKKAIAEIRKLTTALKKISTWYVPYDKSTVLLASYKEKVFTKNLLKKLKNINLVLEEYIDELLDVSQEYKLDYEQFIHRVSEFLENFYDGLISDWIFHKELKVSSNLVVETIDKIKRIQAMLKNDAKDSLAEEEKERETLKKLLLDTKLP